MPRQFDFNEAIRNTVQSAVDEALGPHLLVLQRLAAVLGQLPPARAGRASNGVRGKERRGRQAKNVATAKPFLLPATLLHPKHVKEGIEVAYRQGRGIFNAKVQAVSSDDGLVTLQREKDRKQVVRPITKLYERVRSH